MLSPALVVCLLLSGCQGGASSSPPQPTRTEPIEVLDATRSVIARVIPGRPCRATVDGVELIVGGRPLIASNGTDRWTGEDAENGTTLRKNDQMVARIHANQLFDETGVPILRVDETGNIIDKANALARKAVVKDGSVEILDLTVTHTTDVALAAMLTAREAVPEIRALAACHFLLNEKS